MQGAALKLAYMEYADLQLGERLALLQALLEQALDCELVRELITSNVEAMALPRQKKPVRCSACCICVVADAAISANANCLTCGSSDVCLHENRHALMSAYRMMCCSTPANCAHPFSLAEEEEEEDMVTGLRTCRALQL